MTERFQLTENSLRKEYPNVVADYLRLPSYKGKRDLFEQQSSIQEIRNPAAEAHYAMIRDNASKMAVEEGKYSEAVALIKENLEGLNDKGFDSHDSKAIKIFFLRRLGYIYEHWATFGEKDKPRTDLNRRKHFLLAAYHYMLGDIELGVITEYASRISESLCGIGLFEQARLFDVAFWGPNISYVTGDQPLDIELLRQKAVSEVGVQETGGITVEDWWVDLPDTNNN